MNRFALVLACALASIAPARQQTSSSGAAQPDATAQLLTEVASRIAETLNAVTLRDFVTRAETLGVKRATGRPQMYYI